MISARSLQGFTTEEIGKLEAALALVNRIIPSIDFKWQITDHETLSGASGFENTEDPPRVVYAKIQAAFNTGVSLDFSIYSESFWQRMKRHVSGWLIDGFEDDDGTHINREFFSQAELPDIAGNIAHEFCHSPYLNYRHDFEPTARRQHSVPYAVGRIVAELSANGLPRAVELAEVGARL